MSEDRSAQDGDADTTAAPAHVDAPRDPDEVHLGHGWFYAALAVFAISLLFGLWGVWKVLTTSSASSVPANATSTVELDRLRQQVATLSRSDQISRSANVDLQKTLAERDEEIAGLRADVAFYERFVGADGPRRGLSVHEIKLEPANGQAWHFTITLTQTLNRDEVSSGRLTLALEGTRNGQLQKFEWPALRGKDNSAPLDYSFKYFQQVQGDIVLPAGVQPVRIRVRLVPAGGKAIEQSFPWDVEKASQSMRKT